MEGELGLSLISKSSSIVQCKHCGNTSFTVKEKGPHIGLYCAGCKRWIKWVPQKEAYKYAKQDI